MMTANRMNITKLISTGRTTAFISFIGGTIIILLFYFTNAIELGFLGLFFIAIIGIINLVIVGQLIFKFFKDKQGKKKVLGTIGLMLLNIPIVLIYCWFAITLLNTMRITFVNAALTQLNDIKIYGCEEKHINALSPGQSKTVWVGITGDCSISIDYKLNGQIKTEEVAGYVTNSNGQIITFKIATNQKSFDKDL